MLVLVHDGDSSAQEVLEAVASAALGIHFRLLPQKQSRIVDENRGHLVGDVLQVDGLFQVVDVEVPHESSVVRVLFLELLSDDVLDWRGVVLEEGVVVVEQPQELVSVLHHEVQLELVELVVVEVDLALARLVDLGTLLLHGLLQICVHFGSRDVWHVHDELQETLQSRLWVAHDVLVPYDVHWDLGIDPEFVEVLPNRNVLLDEVGPHLRELGVVLVFNTPVVTASADHVEERRNAVDWVPHQQNGSFGVELGFAVPLGIVGLDNHDSLIHEAFSGQAHEH